MVSAMLILDTEMETRSEVPPASQLLRGWAARLRAWLRQEPQPDGERDKSTGEESTKGQDDGMGLIL